MDTRLAPLVLLAVLLGPFLALTVGTVEDGAFPVLVAVAVGIFGWRELKGTGGRWNRFSLAVSFGLTLPAFYGTVGKAIGALGLPRRDEALMGMDRKLFGWIFPDGQISQWFQANSYIGPETAPGRALSDLLTVSYFSYYFWGFALFFFLLGSYALAEPERREHAWSRLKRFLCAWNGAYFINFICYMLVPAIGPRFYFPERFTTSVDGFGLAGAIQNFIIGQQATSEDCFPSGHTALSWITAFVALQLTPRYGRFALAAAVPITIATLYLRYHYVTDLIAAVPLILTGLAWGGFLEPWKSKSAQPGAAPSLGSAQG